jgi:hypothetical protein
MAGYRRSDPGRINDVLARQTRYVGTGPADIFPFDNGGSSSCLGHVPGHDLAGGAGSEHNDVVLFWRAHMIHFLLCVEKTADNRGGVITQVPPQNASSLAEPGIALVRLL